MKRTASPSGEPPSKRTCTSSPASPAPALWVTAQQHSAAWRARVARVGPSQGLLDLPPEILEDILGVWVGDGVSLRQWPR
jgi:hypothetical protein